MVTPIRLFFAKRQRALAARETPQRCAPPRSCSPQARCWRAATRRRVNGRTALHVACSSNRADEGAALARVELLLGAHANPLALYCDPDGRDHQPFIHEAAGSAARLVQRLLRAGAPIDGAVMGNLTLYTAVCAAHRSLRAHDPGAGGTARAGRSAE